MLPKVSILIPCYNADQWIEQSVTSALNQTWQNKEVIVVDDASTDDSKKILEKFGDRIQLETETKRGGNPTRNRLLEMSNGEWIQFLDADDYLLPEKVEKQMVCALQNSKADVIHGPLTMEMFIAGSVDHAKEACVFKEGMDLWEVHSRWDLAQTGSILARRTILEKIGGWNEQFPCCQDNELFFRLLKADSYFAYCDYNGTVYRRFEGDTVSTKNLKRLREKMLFILSETESYLEGTQKLTRGRLNAINQQRFCLARHIWLVDVQWAKSIVRQIKKSMPNFVPELSNYVPGKYLWVYKILGFSGAEKIASILRKN